MGGRSGALAAAAANVAGVLLGAQLTSASVPLVAMLVALGLAARSRAGLLLAWFAVGLLAATVGIVPTRDAFDAMAPDRPVALTGRVEGCWQRHAFGARALYRVRSLAHRDGTSRIDKRITLHVPDVAAVPTCGGQLRVRGYLKPPRTFHNDPAVTVGRWSLWLKSERLLDVLERPGPWARLSAAVRERLDVGNPMSRRRPGRALARALLLGEARALPDAQVAALRRLGLGHLLAVSGLHVGMVVGLVHVLSLSAPRRLRLLAATTAGLAYAVVVGPRPSVLRAATMTVVLLGALAVRRPPLPAHALGLAVLGLVASDPAIVTEIGFQLSAAATAGIVVATVSVVEWLRRRARRLGRLDRLGRLVRLDGWGLPVAVTLTAQVATLPWALAVFHRISPSASLMNLIAVPWAAVTLGVALLWAAATLAGAGSVAAVVMWVLDLLSRPPAWLTSLPPSRWLSWTVVADWSEIAVGVCVAGVFLWSLTSRRPWPTTARKAVVRSWAGSRRVVLAVAMLVTCGMALAGRDSEATPEVAVVAFDVGHGDAILLRDRERAVLVDGGGWHGGGFGTRVVRPALVAADVRRLDAVVVTHADWDHCGGVVDLLSEVAVEEIWTGELDEESGCGRRLAAARWVRRRRLVRGDRLRVGRWSFEVLADGSDEARSANGRSLLLRARALGRGILLTGDAGAASERRLLRRHPSKDLVADLLKVGHHGSKSSTSDALLAAVRPRLAIVSAGRRNPYGHPAGVVLKRLRRADVGILRTDLHGMIRIDWGAESARRVSTLRAPTSSGGSL